MDEQIISLAVAVFTGVVHVIKNFNCPKIGQFVIKCHKIEDFVAKCHKIYIMSC